MNTLDNFHWILYHYDILADRLDAIRGKINGLQLLYIFYNWMHIASINNDKWNDYDNWMLIRALYSALKLLLKIKTHQLNTHRSTVKWILIAKKGILTWKELN